MKITAIKGLTTEQERIYDGLMQIGHLIGAFYIDAILILREQCMLQTKVNLVAHCAREIDGGLRDIFAPDKEKLLVEGTLSGKNKGQYASILVALGNNNKTVADEWLDVAKQFHGLAHRHEPWLKPKQVPEISSLWTRYEKILGILSGSVYAIRDRIDQITRLDEPTPEILAVIPTLIKGRQNEFQFFKSLSKPDWLKPLHSTGAFSLKNIEPVYDQQGRQVLIDWLPLRYFANISGIATMRKEALIVTIIGDLKNEVIEGKLFVDDYSVYMIYKSLGTLKNYVFNKSDTEFLDAYYNYAPKGQFPLHESYLLDTLVERYVLDKNKDGLMSLLVYCFSFRTEEEQVTGFDEFQTFTQNRVTPNLNSVTHHHVIDGLLKDIIAIAGADLLFKLVEVVEELSKIRSYELNSIPSVETSDQTEMYTYDWVLNIIQFTRNGAELLQPADLIPLVSHLLSKNVDILQRLGIHLIRLNFAEIGYLFWEWIGKNQLQGYFNIHELYLLIQKISPDLSIGELNTLIGWVENMRYESEHYKKEELELYKIHRIKSYLSAFSAKSNPQSDFIKKRQDYFASLDGWPLSHPEFDTYSTSSVGYDIPIQQKELEAMPVKDQVKFIAGYESQDDFDTKPQGLGLLLNNVIIGDPAKYEAELTGIFSLGAIYLQSAIYAFGHVIKNGNLGDWKALVEKIDERLLSNAEAKKNLKDFEQALSAFAELLVQLEQHGGNFKFSLADLEYLIKLCIRLLTETFPDHLEEIGSRDYMSERLNSLWGKAFDAMIGFNRIWGNESKSTDKVNPDVILYLERKLNEPEKTELSFFVNLGWHFPYLLSIAPDWCATNAQKIFPSQSDYRLGLVVNNLISPYQQVFKNVLAFLKDHGLNHLLVDREYADVAELNRISRYGLTELNYVDGKAFEKDGTITNLILKREDPGQYVSLITVAIQNKEANKSVMATLWKNMADIVAGKGEDFLPVKNNIGAFALVSGISQQTLDLLDQAVPYMTNMPTTYQLLGLLYRKFDIDPSRIADTIATLWEQTNMRVMVTDELTNFIEKLYAIGLKEKADNLCLYVATQGNFELKAIFDQFQTSSISQS